VSARCEVGCGTPLLLINCRWTRDFLAGDANKAGCFAAPVLRVEGLDSGVLQLVAASVADPSAKAMPFPVFATEGWLIESVPSFSPFDRLGLWAAYMEVSVCTMRATWLVLEFHTHARGMCDLLWCSEFFQATSDHQQDVHR
jgi:hypothetical protein